MLDAVTMKVSDKIKQNLENGDPQKTAGPENENQHHQPSLFNQIVYFVIICLYNLGQDNQNFRSRLINLVNIRLTSVVCWNMFQNYRNIEKMKLIDAHGRYFRIHFSAAKAALGMQMSVSQSETNGYLLNDLVVYFIKQIVQR